MDEETLKRLDELPDGVFRNYIMDATSDSIAMSVSTFMMAMQFKTLSAIDMFDYSCARLRKLIIKKENEDSQ
jgi:hypothetical protein